MLLIGYMWYWATSKESLKIWTIELSGNGKFTTLVVVTAILLLLLGFHQLILISLAIASSKKFIVIKKNYTFQNFLNIMLAKFQYLLFEINELMRKNRNKEHVLYLIAKDCISKQKNFTFQKIVSLFF
ncbi:hypothetical protein RFI_38580 [Reticulomyxa filosa]|uniref:Uncharacterized protein n=1 Tax=Reticulomyxa filosa TaxID=46433 RepID=X6LA74_RETFI|nr:hypothetical protein RFI_38580 [Reticulomyxa filosa]|eukprot:ETN98907.1 hypothetical protein RFI_38580 [Reticulomyxa filosa]